VTGHIRISIYWLTMILGAQGAIAAADVQSATPVDAITTVTITVMDSLNGQRLAGATVQLVTVGARPHVMRSWVTDGTGTQKLELPTPTPKELKLWAIADGYVPSETLVQRDVSAVFPQIFNIRLAKAVTVGGIVLDESGKPLTGVQVRAELRESKTSNASVAPETQDSFHYEKTDDNGRWSCSHVPKQLQKLRFHFVHSEYIAADILPDSTERIQSGEASVSAADLLAGRASTLLKRGFVLNGVVLDTNQRPVEGAQVDGPDYPIWTPADGHFSFHNCPTGSISLTAYAKGFSPQRKRFHITETNKEALFQLDKGSSLRLRVQDLRGRPIPQARVAVESWQGQPTSQWQWETDQQGRLVWDSAPADEVLYAFNHVGYEMLRGQVFKADGQEKTVTLVKHLQISGKVVDADTSAPVPEFRIIPGQLHVNHYDWNTTNILDGKRGNYLISLPTQVAPHLLQVQANGYYAEISRTFKDDEEDGVADFRLKRGEPLSGKVQLPDGKPASKARVALCTPDNEVVIGENGLLDSDLGWKSETDERGNFVFQPRRDIKWIAAANEQGYAEVSFDDFKRSPALILKPWGRINGSLRSGSLPGTNQLLKLIRVGSLSPQLHPNRFTRLTDGIGRFTFERVPPGQLIIGRVINMQFSHAQIIDISPAQTVNLSLGAGGRTVTGKIESADGQELDWEAGNHPAFLRVSSLPLGIPKLADSVATNRWMREFWDSSDGRARQQSNVTYVFEFSSNNVFRVDNVSPGTYECEIHYHQPASVADQPDVCLGILKQPVTIPPGEPRTPINLGTLKIHLRRTP
jgi:uncharacterized GH25 family protein